MFMIYVISKKVILKNHKKINKKKSYHPTIKWAKVKKRCFSEEEK